MSTFGLDSSSLKTLINYYVQCLASQDGRFPPSREQGVLDTALGGASGRELTMLVSPEDTLSECYRKGYRPTRTQFYTSILNDFTTELKIKEDTAIFGENIQYTGGAIGKEFPTIFQKLKTTAPDWSTGTGALQKNLNEFVSAILNEYEKFAKKKLTLEGGREVKEIETTPLSAEAEAAAAELNRKAVETESGKDIFGQELSAEKISQRAISNRLSEQAALILSIEEIWSKCPAFTSAFAKLRQKPLSYRHFKNFAPIRYDDPSATPTGHFFLSKFYTKTKEMNVFFNNIPPQAMSFLLPSIKLYKTFYPPDVKDTNVSYDWRIPFDDVPIYYDDVTSRFVSEIEKEEKILSGEGTFKTVGIKSFTYEYKGNNPEAINTNIHANLKIFFQSPALLLQELKFKIPDPKFANKVSTFSYSDLINQQERTSIIDGQQKINEKYYRIKIECGYADIDKKILEDVLLNAGKTPQEVDFYYRAIKSTKVVLFLSPYKYDVAFQDDGTVELSIDFNAAMDSILSSNISDIFQITEQSKDLLKQVKLFEDFLAEKDKSSPSEAPNDSVCKSQEEIKKLTEKFKQETGIDPNTPVEDILKKLSQVKATLYNSIFTFLLGKENIHTSDQIDSENDANPRHIWKPTIWNAAFYPDILGVGYTDEEDKLKQRIKAFQDRNSNVIKEIADLADFVPPEFTSATAEQQAKAANEQQLKEADNSKQVYNIKFIFLGDIIDIALQTLENIQPEQDIPRIVLGNIPIAIPTFEGKFEDLNIKSSLKTKKTLYPNLADIPISFNLFQEFMLKNVVEQKRTIYSVNEFIKDLITQLVYPAIQPSVLGNPNAINASIRFSTSYLTFKHSGNSNLISGGRHVSDRYYPSVINENIYTRIESFAKGGYLYLANNNNTTSNLREKSKNVFPYLNYIFITCTSVFPVGLKGDEEKDKNNGIFHIRMGTETGIIKKVVFERMQIPYQREMIARNEGKGFGTGLKQYYNAKVEMFGNDIFRPGDYIYIHPNYIYNKAAINLTDKLGIGGYYLILDVSTDLNEGFYSTKINCVFQATVDEKGNVKDVTKPCSEVK